MYRIMWSMPNGDTGNGEYCLTLEAAEAWLKYLESKHPDMKHWLDERV